MLLGRLLHAFQLQPLTPETLGSAGNMDNLTRHLLDIVGIGGEILLGRDMKRVFLEIIMGNARGILADRYEIVLNALDKLVDIHAELLVGIGVLCSGFFVAELFQLLAIFLLVDVEHGRLVYIEDSVDILTGINPVFLLVCIRESIVLRTAYLLISIVLVDILIEVRPHKWHTFLTLHHRFTAVVGLVVHGVPIGLEPALVTVHCHDESVSGSDAHRLVIKVRNTFLGAVQENASILTGSLKDGNKNLSLSLCARFLGDSFFCHKIVSFNGEKLGNKICLFVIVCLDYALAPDFVHTARMKCVTVAVRWSSGQCGQECGWQWY